MGPIIVNENVVALFFKKRNLVAPMLVIADKPVIENYNRTLGVV